MLRHNAIFKQSSRIYILVTWHEARDDNKADVRWIYLYFHLSLHI